MTGRSRFCLDMVCQLLGLPPGGVTVPSPEAVHVSLDSHKPRTLGTYHLNGLGLSSEAAGASDLGLHRSLSAFSLLRCVNAF